MVSNKVFVRLLVSLLVIFVIKFVVVGVIIIRLVMWDNWMWFMLVLLVRLKRLVNILVFVSVDIDRGVINLVVEFVIIGVIVVLCFCSWWIRFSDL